MMLDGPILSCGTCGSADLLPVLDLGHQPLAERMEADAPRYPLRLVRCASCDLVQLDYIVPPAEVFPPEHPYASGNARALHDHFRALAEELAVGLSDGDVVVDIGCNDGTLLGYYPGTLRRVGVDPTRQVEKVYDRGIIGYREFFTGDLAREIREARGPAKVVTTTNVLAHVPDPHDFLDGVMCLLDDDGVFVTENHDVASVLNGQWDTVYHEHLRYYSPATLIRLLRMHGFEVTGIKRISTHGGSFRTYTRKRDRLQGEAEAAAAELRAILEGIPPYQAIAGIGATTRASGLIHFARIAEFLSCVCEVSTSEKIGTVMPGTSVPVVDEAVLFGDDQPPVAVVFAWHLAGQLIPTLREKGYRGKLLVPLPRPRFV